MDVRDLERKLERVEESKLAIKQAIEKAGQSVGDIPFREYAAKIDEAVKEWTPPDYFPFDIVKILDEDEDSNRIIAEGGGSVIILINLDIQDISITLSAQHFSAYKSSDNKLLIAPPARNTPFSFARTGNIKNKYGNWCWFIWYFEGSTEPSIDNYGATSNAIIWGYLKANKFVINSINCEYISNLENVVYQGIPNSSLQEWQYRKNSTVNLLCYEYSQSVQRIFLNTPNIRIVNLVDIKNNLTNLYPARSDWTFSNCWSLQHINGTIDMSKANNQGSASVWTFPQCVETVWINNLGKPIREGAEEVVTVSIAGLTKLRLECLLYMLKNALEVSGKVMTLGAINLAKLTDAEKKIATDKGWILQ